VICGYGGGCDQSLIWRPVHERRGGFHAPYSLNALRTTLLSACPILLALAKRLPGSVIDGANRACIVEAAFHGRALTTQTVWIVRARIKTGRELALLVESRLRDSRDAYSAPARKSGDDARPSGWTLLREPGLAHAGNPFSSACMPPRTAHQQMIPLAGNCSCMTPTSISSLLAAATGDHCASLVKALDGGGSLARASTMYEHEPLSADESAGRTRHDVNPDEPHCLPSTHRGAMTVWKRFRGIRFRLNRKVQITW